MVKYKKHGNLESYKARLIAKGFTQTYRIDYKETFALMTEMNSISLAANLNWSLQQLDMKNVFLNDVLEEVFTDLPMFSTPDR